MPKRMSNQSRVAKVLVALLASMTVGAVVLMALGNNPPKGDLTTFSLSDRVNIAAIIPAGNKSPSSRWNAIEVFYSGTTGGGLAELAAHQGRRSTDELDCHIVICNSGTEVVPTPRWDTQASATSASGRTIRVCVIGNGRDVCAGQRQRDGLRLVVDHLCRKFSIQPQSIYYSQN